MLNAKKYCTAHNGMRLQTTTGRCSATALFTVSQPLTEECRQNRGRRPNPIPNPISNPKSYPNHDPNPIPKFLTLNVTLNVTVTGLGRLPRFCQECIYF